MPPFEPEKCLILHKAAELGVGGLESAGPGPEVLARLAVVTSMAENEVVHECRQCGVLQTAAQQLAAETGISYKQVERCPHSYAGSLAYAIEAERPTL